MLVRYIFGHDIFVSYARKDGLRYASTLADTLAENGFSCFIDQWATTPGQRIPLKVLRSLKRCSIMVLVGTEEACLSTSVQQELNLFKRTARTIIPVDVSGSLREAMLSEELLGLPYEYESIQAVQEGRPSTSVLRRIEGAITFVRQSSRIKRASYLALLLIVLAVGMSGYLGVKVRWATEELTQVNVVRDKAIQQIEKLKAIMDKAIGLDTADLSRFRIPYDKERDEARKIGAIWTGDPAVSDDLNIDDLFQKERRYDEKWIKYLTEEKLEIEKEFKNIFSEQGLNIPPSKEK